MKENEENEPESTDQVKATEKEQEKEETVEDTPIDYTNKVRLSDVDHDAVSKNTATALVNASHLPEFHKKAMKAQIKDGRLHHPYVETFKRLQGAKAAGSTYRPGSDGL